MTARYNTPPSSTKVPWRWWPALLLVVALLLLNSRSVDIGQWLESQKFFDSVTLEVSSSGRFVSRAEVLAVARPLVAGRLMWEISIKQIKQQVEALPWIERAVVKRKWPDQVAIEFSEQQPFARWGGDKLLSRSGDIFPIEEGSRFEKLPRLNGPDDMTVGMWAHWQHYQAALKAEGFTLTELTVDKRHAWELVLGNEIIVKLGRSAVEKRFQTFLKTHYFIDKTVGARQVLVIDLRYSNGFAIRMLNDQPMKRVVYSERGKMDG